MFDIIEHLLDETIQLSMWGRKFAAEEIKTLRQRVAEQELTALKQQGNPNLPLSEPVAWYDPKDTNPETSFTFDKVAHERWPNVYPVALYTTPPANFSNKDISNT